MVQGGYCSLREGPRWLRYLQTNVTFLTSGLPTPSPCTRQMTPDLLYAYPNKVQQTAHKRLSGVTGVHKCAVRAWQTGMHWGHSMKAMRQARLESWLAAWPHCHHAPFSVQRMRGPRTVITCFIFSENLSIISDQIKSAQDSVVLYQWPGHAQRPVPTPSPSCLRSCVALMLMWCFQGGLKTPESTKVFAHTCLGCACSRIALAYHSFCFKTVLCLSVVQSQEVGPLVVGALGRVCCNS